MNRATPSRVARAERQERNSPYARPEPKIKRSTSLISFPGIRSLVSYITHPFARSPTSRGLPFANGDIDMDQKSESGSEDGWNGGPAQQMQQGDVFEAEAAKGQEAESRSEKLRAGEKPGGRRDTARKNLEVSAANVDQPLISPIMPGHLAPGLKAAPSLPSLGTSTQPLLGYASPSIGSAVSTLTSTLKRRLSPTKPERTLPARSPLPTFAPSTPAAQPFPHSTSASSVALKAFLDAKNGQPLTPEDLRVIESLTENARQESTPGAGPSTRGTPHPEVGGWAAGKFTPRAIKALPSNYTPVRPAGSAFGTPTTAGFSMGVSPPRTGTPGRFDSPGSVRYIGPGWSAKRMYPQQKSHLKPLFKFNLGDEGIAKKRKVDEFETGRDEDIPPVPPLPSSVSMPNFASSSRTPSRPVEIPTSTPISKPSPKAKPDPISVGKRRAADIMLDLINAEMAESPKEAPPPFIVNPYHPDAHTLVAAGKPSPSPVPSSPMRNSDRTPRKSILKLSTSSQTPLRGAAKRLEEAKNAAPTPSKLTALEMLSRREPEKETRAKEAKDGKAKGKGRAAIDRSEMVTEDESSEVEELFNTNSAREVDVEMGSPVKRVRIAEPAEEEPVKAYTAPQLSSTPLPLPSSSPSPASVASTSTPSSSFTPSSSSSGLAPAPPSAPTPKFTPSPLSHSIIPDEPKFSLGISSPAKPSAPISVKDLAKIYLSAKDTALSIAKEALPFFTFSSGVKVAEESAEIKRAKEEALKREMATFVFTLDTTPIPSSSAAPKAAPAAGGPWTCDLCMLSNPATALEACTVCEAPRPGASAPPAPAVASGPWTCDLCMLSNPATAVEACTVCEAPRPGASAPAPSIAPTPVAQPVQAFNWAAATGGSAKPAEKNEGGAWTCGTCMLSNPASATEKCTVCETPRG